MSSNAKLSHIAVNMLRKDAISILPEEMWKAIFSEIKDPQDWLNLCRTCSSLQRIMKSEKVTALLPEVLPHVKKYLDRGNLLKARLVCKKWKANVDKLIESDVVSQRWKSDAIGEIAFSQSAKIEQFLIQERNLRSNPFFGRAVRLLWYDNREAPDVFSANVRRLLERFGSYVRNITFDIFSVNEDATFPTAPELANFLRLVPNLPVFNVSLFLTARMRLEESPDLEEDEHFQGIEMEYPLHVLQNLESLTLFGPYPKTYKELIKIIWRMCIYPEKLKHLYIFNIPDNLTTMFPSIEELEGRFGEIDFTTKLGPCPLKSISSSGGSTLRFEVVFPVFQRFQNTLTKLVLMNNVIVPDGDETMVELPNLKELEFGIVYCGSLDFLLGFQALEKLTMNWVKFVFQGRGIVQAYGIENEMYKSNIWTLLQNLKKFSFNGNWQPGHQDSNRKLFQRHQYHTFLSQ